MANMSEKLQQIPHSCSNSICSKDKMPNSKESNVESLVQCSENGADLWAGEAKARFTLLLSQKVQ